MGVSKTVRRASISRVQSPALPPTSSGIAASAASFAGNESAVAGVNIGFIIRYMPEVYSTSAMA
jgi:hypothetical protein